MTQKLFEDENLVIVDKPAGLVVHPGAGLPAVALAKVGEHPKTLVDWLFENYPEIKKLNWPELERAGIIHRLDKDTSGLMMLAKNPETLAKMQKLFQAHSVKKTYLALVFGKLEKADGEIAGFIGRDPNARRQQISRNINFDFQPGKVRESKTHYKTLHQYQYKNYDLTLVEATLETGRMHQIRVHFKSIGHPVIGDQIYNIKHSRKVSKELGLTRQFLHAYIISFKNPFDNKQVEVKSELPEELKIILEKLNNAK